MEIMVIALTVVFGIQLCYFALLYARVLFYRETPALARETVLPVTVVVCARSEAKNIMELVPILMEQDYATFEVLVVNDRSWDDTSEILEALKIKYPALRFITIEDNDRHHFAGKKMALTLGIKGATYEHLIFTDADCRPLTNQWLKHMVHGFAQGKVLVLGYSPYRRRPGFLNRLIRFDAYAIAMNYIAMAKAGMPYMGVGRNMGYTKTLHFAKGGFRSHYHIASGDDDIFVNQNATATNTAIVLNPASHVESLPKTSWLEWKIQKTRHMTASNMYKKWHKFIIGLYALSLLAFYVLLPLTIFLNKALFISLTFFGVRTLVQIITFRGSSKWLGNKDVAILAPFYEVLVMTINTGFYFRSLFARKSKWN